jgi:hypothetical protein
LVLPRKQASKQASNFRRIIHSCSSRRPRVSFPIRFKLQFKTAPFLHEAQENGRRRSGKKCNINGYQSSSFELSRRPEYSWIIIR